MFRLPISLIKELIGSQEVLSIGIGIGSQAALCWSLQVKQYEVLFDRKVCQSPGLFYATVVMDINFQIAQNATKALYT